MVDNYIQCGWRRAWILWDLDNGHAQTERDNGKGYMWVFSSYKEAMNHRRNQHKKEGNARLSIPVKIEGDRRFI